MNRFECTKMFFTPQDTFEYTRIFNKVETKVFYSIESAFTKRSKNFVLCNACFFNIYVNPHLPL